MGAVLLNILTRTFQMMHLPLLPELLPSTHSMGTSGLTSLPWICLAMVLGAGAGGSRPVVF